MAVNLPLQAVELSLLGAMVVLKLLVCSVVVLVALLRLQLGAEGHKSKIT